MSLAAHWSGNLHQLRITLGSNSGVNLFRFHTGLIPQIVFDVRRCNLYLTTRRLEEQKPKLKSNKPCRINLKLQDGTVESSTDKNSNQSVLHETKAIQCYKLQESNVERGVDRSATILVFDIETTGFSRQNDRIIEVALRDLIGGKNSTFQTLVNPGKDVSNAYVHGIHSHMVNRPDVPRFGELVPILLQFVKSRQVAGRPVVWVAHNGRRFDVPFFKKEFKRCSVEIPADWVFVDTLPLARKLVNPDGSKLASLSLEALGEHFGIAQEGPAHRAMQDVEALCYVLKGITFNLELPVPELIAGGFRASDI